MDILAEKEKQRERKLEVLDITKENSSQKIYKYNW